MEQRKNLKEMLAFRDVHGGAAAAATATAVAVRRGSGRLNFECGAAAAR